MTDEQIKDILVNRREALNFKIQENFFDLLNEDIQIMSRELDELLLEQQRGMAK